MKKKLLCSHFVGSKQSLCDQRLLSGGEVLAEVVGEHFRNKKVILKRPRSRTALVYEIVGKSRDGTYLFRASNQRGKAAEDVFVMGLTSAKESKGTWEQWTTMKTRCALCVQRIVRKSSQNLNTRISKLDMEMSLLRVPSTGICVRKTVYTTEMERMARSWKNLRR